MKEQKSEDATIAPTVKMSADEYNAIAKNEEKESSFWNGSEDITPIGWISFVIMYGSAMIGGISMFGAVFGGVTTMASLMKAMLPIVGITSISGVIHMEFGRKSKEITKWSYIFVTIMIVAFYEIWRISSGVFV